MENFHWKKISLIHYISTSTGLYSRQNLYAKPFQLAFLFLFFSFFSSLVLFCFLFCLFCFFVWGFVFTHTKKQQKEEAENVGKKLTIVNKQTNHL